MICLSADGGRAAAFKKWLGAHVPSCNDNDDPNHNSTLIARPPAAENDAAGALSPEQRCSAWPLPAVEVSI